MKRVIKICIFGVLLVLAGCRSESLVETEELHQENAKKIVFFENYAKNKNYKYDAEWLNYDDVNNPAIPFAQTLRAYLMNNERDVQEIARQYGRLDLEVSSPVFTDDKTGRQMVYFPILKGKEVSAVLSCVVEKDFSRMGFAVYPKSENLKGIIAEFQSHYFNETRLVPLNRGKNKEGDGSKDNPKNIEGITIVKILAPPNDFCMSFYMGVESEGNDCEGKDGVRRDIAGLIDPWKNPFPDWFPDGGGDEPPPPPTPCDKGHKAANHPELKQLMKDLKDNVHTSNAEEGFWFSYNGSGISQTRVVGKAGTAEMDIDIPAGTKIDGIFHIHYDGLLSIFSIDDIFALAQLYKNGNIKDVNTFVMGVITASNTQYMLVIDNPDLLRNFANDIIDGNKINKSMLRIYSDFYKVTYNIKPENTAQVNEDSFVNFLDKMNIGLKLLKGNDEMTKWKSMEGDGNGKAKPKDCK